jgi:hypothetical protein
MVEREAIVETIFPRANVTEKVKVRLEKSGVHVAVMKLRVTYSPRLPHSVSSAV